MAPRVVAVDVGSVRSNFAWAALDLPGRRPVVKAAATLRERPSPSSRHSTPASRWRSGSRLP